MNGHRMEIPHWPCLLLCNIRASRTPKAHLKNQWVQFGLIYNFYIGSQTAYKYINKSVNSQYNKSNFVFWPWTGFHMHENIHGARRVLLPLRWHLCKAGWLFYHKWVYSDKLFTVNLCLYFGLAVGCYILWLFGLFLVTTVLRLEGYRRWRVVAIVACALVWSGYKEEKEAHCYHWLLFWYFAPGLVAIQVFMPLEYLLDFVRPFKKMIPLELKPLQ